MSIRARVDGMAIVEPEGTCAAGGVKLMADARVEQFVEVFKALADPTRVRLVAYVASAKGGTVCACHLPEQLGITQPTLSHHLKKLVEANLLVREQRGRWAHYVVNPRRLELVEEFLGIASACC